MELDVSVVTVVLTVVAGVSADFEVSAVDMPSCRPTKEPAIPERINKNMLTPAIFGTEKAFPRSMTVMATTMYHETFSLFPFTTARTTKKFIAKFAKSAITIQ